MGPVGELPLLLLIQVSPSSNSSSPPLFLLSHSCGLFCPGSLSFPCVFSLSSPRLSVPVVLLLRLSPFPEQGSSQGSWALASMWEGTQPELQSPPGDLTPREWKCKADSSLPCLAFRSSSQSPLEPLCLYPSPYSQLLWPISPTLPLLCARWHLPSMRTESTAFPEDLGGVQAISGVKCSCHRGYVNSYWPLGTYV